MCKKISIVSEKGGVGKTTTTFNLASALNHLGHKVLVVDLDKQCNLSSTCGYLPDKKDTICDLIYYAVTGRDFNLDETIRHCDNGVDYIPSSAMLDSINSQIATDADSSYVLKKIFQHSDFSKYDYIIFDNKTAIDLLTQNALNSSDYVIIPAESGIYAFDGIDKILSKVKSLNATTNPKLKVLGILLNKAANNTSVGKAIKDATETLYQDMMFQTVIPLRISQAERVVSSRISCVDDKRNTLRDFYINLANEVIERSK